MYYLIVSYLGFRPTAHGNDSVVSSRVIIQSIDINKITIKFDNKWIYFKISSQNKNKKKDCIIVNV